MTGLMCTQTHTCRQCCTNRQDTKPTKSQRHTSHTRTQQNVHECAHCARVGKANYCSHCGFFSVALDSAPHFCQGCLFLLKWLLGAPIHRPQCFKCTQHVILSHTCASHIDVCLVVKTLFLSIAIAPFVSGGEVFYSFHIIQICLDKRPDFSAVIGHASFSI